MSEYDMRNLYALLMLFRAMLEGVGGKLPSDYELLDAVDLVLEKVSEKLPSLRARLSGAGAKISVNKT